jgi:mRNA-degrading endonuclease RelE of RelBE toxin-antitoxin system
MSYQIELGEEARREMRAVLGNYRQRIRRLIDTLEDNPRPRRAKLLREHTNVYRISLDRWRVIYVIEDDLERITIIRVRVKTGPEIYQDLPLNLS